MTKQSRADPRRGGPRLFHVESGGVLLSHTLPGAVPSALEGLASGFGKGPGVSHSAITTDTTIHAIQLAPARCDGGWATLPAPHPRVGARGWGVVVCSGSHSGCEHASNTPTRDGGG